MKPHKTRAFFAVPRYLAEIPHLEPISSRTMGGKPASSRRELALIDALPRSLSARAVAELVYDNPNLEDRVLRHRRKRREARARLAASDPELAALLRELD
jgi:hypothetical protein